MQILPSTKQERLDLLRLALKVWIIVAAPCMYWCDHVLGSTLQAWPLHKAMRQFVVPTQIGYFAVFLLLIWTGISELSRRMYMRVSVDFIFAVVAFFCIYLLEPLVVELR